MLNQQAQDDLLPRCLTDGVGIVIGGPFNSGILATGAVAGAWYDCVGRRGGDGAHAKARRGTRRL